MFDNARSAAAELAGADRGRGGGQGREGRAGRRRLHGHRRDDEDRQDAALPIHRDAELKIRPRIFLEGNFFVDLKPGTPGRRTSSTRRRHDPGRPRPAPRSSSTRCSARCKSDARKDLQKLLAGLRRGASAGEPKPGEDADQDPDTRGETAGESLNDSLEYSPEALRGTAIVNEALLGTEPRDLSQADQGRPEGRRPRWRSRETQLKDLITNFNTTTGALAAEQANLRAHHPRAARGARARPTRRSTSSTPSFPPLRALLARDDPAGRARDAGHDRRPRCPGSRRRARSCRRASSRASSRDLQPAVARPGASSPTASCSFLPAGRPAQPLPDQHAAAHGRRGDPGRHPHHRRSRTTRSSSRAWSGSSGESQNFDGNGQLHALPDRRRQPDRRPDRRRSGARRPAVRQRAPPAARHAPGPARAASRRTTAPARCYKQSAPEPERAPGSEAGREARDPQAPARLPGDPVHDRRGRRRGRVHPVQPALLPAGLGAGGRAPTSTRSRPSSRPPRRWCRARARR